MKLADGENQILQKLGLSTIFSPVVVTCKARDVDVIEMIASPISNNIQIVLITDRDLPIQSILARLVRVDTATHIEELSDLKNPSIILFDLYCRSVDVLSMIPQVVMVAGSGNSPSRSGGGGPHIFVALLAEYNDGEAIEQAMSVGASGVLSASITDESRLRDKLLRWISTFPDETTVERETLSPDLRETIIRSALIGQSPQMRDIQAMISQIRSSDANVLITGESGTGKEVTASAIHYSSNRARKQMLSINCGALSEHLLESELFGHIKGAFTGATTDNPGLIRAADGGTLFLDEVGEMLPQTQVKLLRVLQTGEIRSVGSTENDIVDVRFVAATNRKLEEEIKVGRFREDLYYRLNVISIDIPPLRNRRVDIPLLARVLLDKHQESKDDRASVSGFDLGAIVQLQSYTWPGNVRELENVIQQILALKPSGQISVADLPKQLVFGNKEDEVEGSGRQFLKFASAKKRAVSAFETDYLTTIMNHSETIAAAASMAGLDRSNFKRLLKKNGLL